MMKRSLPANRVPAQVVLHFSFVPAIFRAIADCGDIWGQRTLAKKESQLTMKVQETAIQITVIAIEHQKDAIAILAITVLSTTTML